MPGFDPAPKGPRAFLIDTALSDPRKFRIRQPDGREIERHGPFYARHCRFCTGHDEAGQLCGWVSALVLDPVPATAEKGPRVNFKPSWGGFRLQSPNIALADPEAEALIFDEDGRVYFPA